MLALRREVRERAIEDLCQQARESAKVGGVFFCDHHVKIAQRWADEVGMIIPAEQAWELKEAQRVSRVNAVEKGLLQATAAFAVGDLRLSEFIIQRLRQCALWPGVNFTDEQEAQISRLSKRQAEPSYGGELA